MAKATEEKDLLKVCVVAGVLVCKDGKFLLVQEKQGKVYGLWNFPAGKVELGQTIAEAASREAKEETGYDVEILDKVGVFHEEGEGSVKHLYGAKIVGGELEVPTDELLDVKWLYYEEIVALSKENKLRGGWIIEAISRYEEANGRS